MMPVWGPRGGGFKKKKKRKNTRAAVRSEVWTKLTPKEDAGVGGSASAVGNKCFGIRQALPLVPAPGTFRVGARLASLVSY